MTNGLSLFFTAVKERVWPWKFNSRLCTLLVRRYWPGPLLHGAGTNASQDRLYGVILTCSASWVRQEQNHNMYVPTERPGEFSPDFKQKAEFDMHRALGLCDPSAA
jgi:hypothetical protein